MVVDLTNVKAQKSLNASLCLSYITIFVHCALSSLRKQGESMQKWLISGMPTQFEATLEELESAYKDTIDFFDYAKSETLKAEAFMRDNKAYPDTIRIPGVPYWFDKSSYKYDNRKHEFIGYWGLKPWNHVNNGAFPTGSSLTYLSNDIDNMIKSYNQVINKATKFIIDVRKGKANPGGSLVKFEYGAVSNKIPQYMYVLYVNSRVKCDLCEKEITVGGLKSHRGKMVCKITADQNRMAKLKLERVLDVKVVNAVSTGELDGDFIPTGYDCYIPKWMNDAIATYNKNGYAGMTLVEFLKMMSPDKSTKES